MKTVVDGARRAGDNLDRLAAGPITAYGDKPSEGRETIEDVRARPGKDES